MKRLLPLIAAALLLAALPSAASASLTQESMFQDDPLLVYGTQEQVEDTLNQLQAFGVDRIRVSVFWKILAPANDSRQKPNFDATDPAGYQQPVWERYDSLIRGALSRGILVNLNITSPIPRWAAGDPPASRQDLLLNWGPEPRGVREVRAGGRQALQRHLPGPAARRLLVDLERAQPGRLADAAVGARPAQPEPPHRVRAAGLPRARRPRCGTAWQPRAMAPTRSSSARRRRRASRTARASRSRSTRCASSASSTASTTTSTS